MTVEQHLVVKPQTLVEAGVAALADKAVNSALVTRRTDFQRFFNNEGDTITQKVPGTLPVRLYDPRNDRSQPIITDVYSETSVNITLAMTRPYSAVRITDEQKEWDYAGGWGNITNAQMETVSQKIEAGVTSQILNAAYERVVKIDDTVAKLKAAREAGEDLYYNGVIDATSALRRMRVNEPVVALIGWDFESKLIKSGRWTKDAGTGDSALTTATLGVLAGVQFVRSNFVKPDEALLFTKSAFLLYTGVHKPAEGATFSKIASAGGYSLRWTMDYEGGYLASRSVFDTLAGYATTKDHIQVYNGESQHLISPDTFFVRGVKIALGSSTAVEKAPGDGKTDTAGGKVDSYLALAYNNKFVATELPTGKPYPLGGNFPAPAVVVP